MAIYKVTTGWQADFKAGGRNGKRFKRTFPTKREAQEFEMREKTAALDSNYTPTQKNKLRLADLIESWYELHGCNLKESEKIRQKLHKMAVRMGNPLADKLTAEDWILYRNDRLNDVTPSGTKVKINTVNHEQRYLSAVYGQLIKLRKWKFENPLLGIPQLREVEPELIFLESDQIKRLLSACEYSKNRDLLVKVKLCLATGARWGEVESLGAMQVKHCKVHYERTKNTRSRAIPITEELQSELLEGRPKRGPLFQTSAKAAFAGAIKAANIELPRGQLTHVLRHTFASHYMINDGNILKLQKALGHKTLAMTMRYAKLAPRHLEETLRKNPLANL